MAGSAYSFAPQSTDAEGDSLSFSIQNKPAWATFNGSTGQLTGTPSATNIGTYASITIAVSDGHSVSALPSFSINVIASPSSTVTLRWIAPSLNTDGTNLNNLAGYRVYYGANEASMDHEIEISDPASTSYTISNLSSGRYYFGLTAYTMGGMESSLSNIGSKLIP